MQPFVFTSDVISLRRQSTRLLELPCGINDKASLLRWYSEALCLPEYFGENWDAFDECLRDLSWLGEHTIVLFHRDVPLSANPRERNTYIELLANASMDWKPGEVHELVVAFDPMNETIIRSLIPES